MQDNKNYENKNEKLVIMDFLHKNAEYDLLHVIQSIHNLRKSSGVLNDFSLMLSLVIGFILGILINKISSLDNFFIFLIVLPLIIFSILIIRKQKSIESEININEKSLEKIIKKHIENI